MIWELSTSYNTAERLTGLLRKVSNEVIARCRESISLEGVFHGDITQSTTVLHDCIAAGERWETLCVEAFENAAARATQLASATPVASINGGNSHNNHHQTKHQRREEQRTHVDEYGGEAHSHSPTLTPTEEPLAASGIRASFDFDRSSVFAEIKAFVQRCRDLLEVCEARTQFDVDADHTSSGASTGLPAFGGTRGPEITTSLLNIRSAFARLIHNLDHLDYSPLDVKATKWHDDHAKFKNSVKVRSEKCVCDR